jgi:CBS-domain-containing membrane protein
MEVAVEVKHNRARDIMEEPNVAKSSEPVGNALGRIFRERLKGIVVVEDSGALVGYVDRMTIISNWPEFVAAR